MTDQNAGRLSALRLEPGEKRATGARRQVGIAGALLTAAIVAVVALAVHASRAASQDTAAAASPAAAPTPATETEGPDQAEVAAGGYIEARRQARLSPGRDGVVDAVHVELGQRVEQDALLLELEHDADEAERAMAAAELELARTRLRAVRAGSRAEEVLAADSEADAAEARFDEARQDLERLEALAPSGAVTAAEVGRTRQRARAAEAQLRAMRARERMLRRGSLPTDVAAAQAQLERAESALRRADARLELARLHAPFAGVIVDLDIEPGEVISLQSGRPVLELADLSELWVRVDIPETRITQVALGAPAELIVDALGDRRLEAEVVELSPLADRQSNTLSVALRVIEPPPQLRPNMSARVFIGRRPSSGGSGS